MKKAAILLGGLLLLSVTLSGCKLWDKVTSFVGGHETSEMNADSVLDNRLYDQATTALNSKVCASIKDEAKKTECTQVVDGLKITNKAVKERDNSVCSSISLSRYKDNCEREIAEAKKADEFAKNLDVQRGKDQDLSSRAFENKDVAICDKISDETSKYNCVYNIVAQQALDANDKTICQQIGDKSFIEMCESNF